MKGQPITIFQLFNIVDNWIDNSITPIIRIRTNRNEEFYGTATFVLPPHPEWIKGARPAEIYINNKIIALDNIKHLEYNNVFYIITD